MGPRCYTPGTGGDSCQLRYPLRPWKRVRSRPPLSLPRRNIFSHFSNRENECIFARALEIEKKVAGPSVYLHGPINTSATTFRGGQ
jgi:hypothetical protein